MATSETAVEASQRRRDLESFSMAIGWLQPSTCHRRSRAGEDALRHALAVAATEEIHRVRKGHASLSRLRARIDSKTLDENKP